jgi:hypothetical protein
MSETNPIAAIAEFLSMESGRPMSGCAPENIAALLEQVKERCPGKPICVVSNWIYADLEVTDGQRNVFQRQGLNPALLWAHNVLIDDRRPHYVGNPVRSTVQVSFTDDCLFETRNTVYVLQGPGVGKVVNAAVIMSILL